MEVAVVEVEFKPALEDVEQEQRQVSFVVLVLLLELRVEPVQMQDGDVGLGHNPMVGV